MKTRSGCLVGVVAAAALLAAAAGASAETCKLELKRLEGTGSSSDYLLRSTYPQHFFQQVGLPGQPRAESTSAAEFSKVIKKEPPKYESEHPFRGVAKLGSWEFGFVLDSAPPEKDADESAKKDTADKAESAAVKLVRYNRLRFDLNHNGDLTDDKVIKADQPRGVRLPAGYASYSFPRVDVSIDVDGTKVDYAFLLSVYSNTSTIRMATDGAKLRTQTIQYASASLRSAAYREGELTLGGKKRHVFLVDFNSNGRFDDEMKIREGVTSSGGQLVPEMGDKLMVDPDPKRQGYRSAYDATSSDDQHDLSKLVNLDGRCYDVKVSAAGDELTLTPSSLPLGYVTNPNKGLRAIVYGPQGFVKISGGGDDPIPLPEGDWKLLSYTIDRTGQPEPAPPAAEKEEEGGRSLLRALSDALVGGAGTTGRVVSGPRYTLVSARATQAYKAVEVRKGQTVPMPFGPPYKPTVTGSFRRSGGTASLSLSLVGSGGEVCSNLVVNGGRPKAPEFTISTADDEEVAGGKFEYG